MSEDKILVDLEEIISDYVEIEDKLDKNMSLQGDMGLDSFGLISMICKIEKHFNIRIPDYELPAFLQLGDLINYISKNAVAV